MDYGLLANVAYSLLSFFGLYLRVTAQWDDILYDESKNYSFEITTTSPRVQWVNESLCYIATWLLRNKAMMTSSNGNIFRQWRGSLMFSLICAWTNGWANNREAGDSRHRRAHYEVNVMPWIYLKPMEEGFYSYWRSKQMPLSCSENGSPLWTTDHKMPFDWQQNQFHVWWSDIN